jgi:hypothetical protein
MYSNTNETSKRWYQVLELLVFQASIDSSRSTQMIKKMSLRNRRKKGTPLVSSNGTPTGPTSFTTKHTQDYSSDDTLSIGESPVRFELEELDETTHTAQDNRLSAADALTALNTKQHDHDANNNDNDNDNDDDDDDGWLFFKFLRDEFSMNESVGSEAKGATIIVQNFMTVPFYLERVCVAVI